VGGVAGVAALLWAHEYQLTRGHEEVDVRLDDFDGSVLFEVFEHVSEQQRVVGVEFGVLALRPFGGGPGAQAAGASDRDGVRVVVHADGVVEDPEIPADAAAHFQGATGVRPTQPHPVRRLDIENAFPGLVLESDEPLGVAGVLGARHMRILWTAHPVGGLPWIVDTVVAMNAFEPDSGQSADPIIGAGVSIIVPVLNEERHLADTVRSVFAQDYAGRLELVLALGPSTDGTDAVARALALVEPRIVLVGNSSGRTSVGLNAALSVARYPVIVRVDGHALIPPDYVRIAVETLSGTGADNVGGIMAASGESPFERAVAWAMTSRLGVGSAAFHVGGKAGPAETVYLGCFRRSALDRVGGYDEDFVRAQDWELNHRIRESGGMVWFTPELRVTYRPRSRPGKLARQYNQYGRWRREVMRTHPGTARRSSTLRYLAPPTLVIGLVVGMLVGLVSVLGGPGWLALGWLAPVGYAALLTFGAISSVGVLGGAAIRLPLVLLIMQVSWGLGFLQPTRSHSQSVSGSSLP
jgi:hypothetical protein